MFELGTDESHLFINIFISFFTIFSICSKNLNYFLVANFHIYPVNPVVTSPHHALSIHNHATDCTYFLTWSWEFRKCGLRYSFFWKFTSMEYLFLSNHFIPFIYSLSNQLFRSFTCHFFLKNTLNEIGNHNKIISCIKVTTGGNDLQKIQWKLDWAVTVQLFYLLMTEHGFLPYLWLSVTPTWHRAS